MANLVPPTNILQPIEARTIEFKGLNKRSAIEDGEMSDMWNLTSDSYPLLMPRKPRGEVDLPDGIKRPIRFVRRYDKLGLIALDENDDVYFYYDGEKITELGTLSAATQAVAINNIMCFFPEKICIDITKQGVQDGTARSLEESVTIPSSNAVTVTITDDNAQIALSASHNFRYDDAINIAGTLIYKDANNVTRTKECTASCAIEGVSGNTLICPRETFIELTGDGATNITFYGSISRTMPTLDLVVEWNNRLWGCSSADNTVYASKLGDPTNWQYFQGTGLDSYYAQQGTDEIFTGIAEYSGHIIFFKPNSMCRIYGTAPSNYQVTNTKAYGVEEGSTASVLTINDTVFYKSAIGIMAYQGGVPVCISEKFNRKFKNVVAGTEGIKYYASCLIEEKNGYEGRLLVFDIDKGFWHKEDDLRFTGTCKSGNKVYYTTASAEILVCNTNIYCARDLMVSSALVEGTAGVINPDTPTEAYEDIEWMAQFGPFDEYLEEHKIYSKLALRLKANGESSAKIYISLDEGEWEQVENYDHISTKGEFIPIVPRRCDRYSVKIEGKGNCEMKSLTRRVRRGTFGRL